MEGKSECEKNEIESDWVVCNDPKETPKAESEAVSDSATIESTDSKAPSPPPRKYSFWRTIWGTSKAAKKSATDLDAGKTQAESNVTQSFNEETEDGVKVRIHDAEILSSLQRVKQEISSKKNTGQTSGAPKKVENLKSMEDIKTFLNNVTDELSRKAAAEETVYQYENMEAIACNVVPTETSDGERPEEEFKEDLSKQCNNDPPNALRHSSEAHPSFVGSKKEYGQVEKEVHEFFDKIIASRDPYTTASLMRKHETIVTEASSTTVKEDGELMPIPFQVDEDIYVLPKCSTPKTEKFGCRRRRHSNSAMSSQPGNNVSSDCKKRHRSDSCDLDKMEKGDYVIDFTEDSNSTDRTCKDKTHINSEEESSEDEEICESKNIVDMLIFKMKQFAKNFSDCV